MDVLPLIVLPMIVRLESSRLYMPRPPLPVIVLFVIVALQKVRQYMPWFPLPLIVLLVITGLELVSQEMAILMPSQQPLGAFEVEDR